MYVVPPGSDSARLADGCSRWPPPARSEARLQAVAPPLRAGKQQCRLLAPPVPIGTPGLPPQRPLAPWAGLHYSSLMSEESGGRPTQTRFQPPLRQIKARHMGELTRGSSLWDVLLETAADAAVGAIRGRIHFISGNTHRLSGWIFLEWSENDIERRFAGFSAQELWNLLKSLDGE